MKLSTLPLAAAIPFTPGLPKKPKSTRFCKSCLTTKPIEAYTPYGGGSRRKVCDSCWGEATVGRTHKRCGTCTLEKPLDQFYKNSRNSDGLSGRCSSCHNGWFGVEHQNVVDTTPGMPESVMTKTCTKCEIEKPLTAFYQQKGGKHGRLSQCIACVKGSYRERQEREYAPGTRKRCRACKVEKLLEDFPVGSATHGRAGVCRVCTQEYQRDYTEAHTHEIKLKAKRRYRRYKANPAEREARSERTQHAKIENHRKYMLRSARQRHYTKGIEMAIGEGDIPDMPERCEVLGIPLFFGKGGPSPNSPSLDRIDNTKGYVPGNLAIISHRANQIKGDASPEELDAVAAYMRRHLTAIAPPC